MAAFWLRVKINDRSKLASANYLKKKNLMVCSKLGIWMLVEGEVLCSTKLSGTFLYVKMSDYSSEKGC